MRVPAAKSSGFWVQPCSITTRGKGSSAKPAGSNSLNARVPAALVKVLSLKRASLGRTTTGASATKAAAASLAALRFDLTSRTKPSRALVRSAAGCGGAIGPGVMPARAIVAGTAASARWIAAVASTSLPRLVSPPAARIFRRRLFFTRDFETHFAAVQHSRGYPLTRANAGRRLFRTRLRLFSEGAGQLSLALRGRDPRHGARDVARFLLDGLVLVEHVVARRIRLVVADEAVQTCLVAGIDQTHPVEPVREHAARALDAGDVAMNDQAVDALVEMLRIVP